MDTEESNSFFPLFLLALRRCLDGVPLTLELTLLSVLFGFFLALPLAIVHAKKNTIGARLVQAYTYFFTGTPLLVQVYILYKGMPEFDWVKNLMQEGNFAFLRDGFFWAWLAFMLNTAAYSTVIFSGAIQNTAIGDIEAARAYGMSRRMATWRIIMPGALRRALPSYSNEVVMMLHSTSLASVVTLYEVTGMAIDFNSEFYEPFPAFVAAACIYLVLTTVLIFGFRRVEKVYVAHLRMAT